MKGETKLAAYNLKLQKKKRSRVEEGRKECTPWHVDEGGRSSVEAGEHRYQASFKALLTMCSCSPQLTH